VIWEEPDIIGFQEVLNNQLDDLAYLLGSSYHHVGVGRDDGKTAGEAVPVFWRKDHVKLLSVQHFWLSEEPEVAGSIGWDAGLTRMATLAHFALLTSDAPTSGDAAAKPSHPSSGMMEKELESFFVLNTHYDDRGTVARKKSSELIVAKLNRIMADSGPDGAHNKLVVVLGDLNSSASQDGYQILTGHRYAGTAPLYTPTRLPVTYNTPITFLDSRHTLLRRGSTDITSANQTSGSPVLGAPFGEHFTYTGFSAGSKQTLIDYILLADNGVIKGDESDNAPWQVAKYGVIPNYFGDGVWVSDHRMVTVTLRKS
jgi:hypothetical protein